MTLNFLHPAFSPVVSCDTPCLDGHDITNLTSTDLQLQNMGFLPESFIKPPISIHICFPLAVDIDKLVFCPAVSTQRTASVEIFSSTTHAKHINFKDTRPHLNPQIIYHRIGQGTYHDNKQLIIFKNYHFKQNRLFAKVKHVSSKQSNTPEDHEATFSLSNHNRQHLWSVGGLTIRMTRSAAGKVCAIKWLEVWGQPSSHCNRETISWILKTNTSLMSAINRHCHPALPIPEKLMDEKVDNKTTNCKRIDNDVFNAITVPSDFIDPITQELLAQPMLLPSGQSVDIQTIEKHNAAEEKWGRPPSDPFTGVKFSIGKVPIPNAELKERIDRFLLQHGSDLPPVARTLGSKQSATGSSKKISQLVIGDRRDPNTSICLDSDSLCTTNLKRKQPQEDISNMSNERHRKNTRKGTDQKSDDYDSQQIQSISGGSSLDAILRSTLQNMPSFLPTTKMCATQSSSSPMNEQNDNQNKCSQCSSSQAPLYKLPCNNILCRSCLLDKTSFGTTRGASGSSHNSHFCKNCNEIHPPQDVVRIHS